MRIDYSTHYGPEYWTRQKTYRDGTGNVKKYEGPSLAWDGFDTIADLLKKIFPGDSVKTALDVGCGGGDLTHRLLNRGWDTYGVDISEYAIANAHVQIRSRLTVADITQAPELPWKILFDLVLATDLLEHIYAEDIEKTFAWIKSLSKRFMFFCVATCHDPTNPWTYEAPQEFVQKKGEEIPLQWEATAISGHVHVKPWTYWAKFFRKAGLKIRWDLMYLFQMHRETDKAMRETWGWCMPNTWVLER